ncbi:MAG TPA: efflux transporter outer membrane subunit, partial [Stellaceae bacterium]|nr:efflux transporter outer membrane subunit [Stellaceae bacterium]
MRTFKLLPLVAASGFLASCTVGPNYRTPETPVPPAFVATAAPAATPTEGSAPPADLAAWWHMLNDAELDSLVKRAISSSLTLEIALTRLQEARTEEAVVLGEALPFADVSAGAGKGTGTNSTRGRIAPPLNAASNATGLKELTHVVGFDAGWEIDIFGKYRREIEAAQYDTQAATEARNNVLVSVVADVVRAYLDMRGLQMRLAVARQGVDLAKRTLDVVQIRFNRGLTNELDLALAQREYATLESTLAPLNAQVQAAQYVIAVLLGQFPEELSKELAAPNVIPPLPQAIQPGLPLDLLRRRPDIRESERQLAASTARIGVAIADLFPRLSLTGGLGFQGQGLGKTPVTNKFIWSAGPSAYWPFLDFGTLDAL